jgi:hypothetical protein
MDRPGGIGRIKEDYKADIVVFDSLSTGMATAAEYDRHVAVVRHSDTRDVETVIIDGVVRRMKWRLMDLDLEGKKINWDEIRRELVRSQTGITKKIEGLNMIKARDMLVQLYHVDVSTFERIP